MGCVTLLFALLHVVPVIGSQRQTHVKSLGGRWPLKSPWLEISQWLSDKGGWVDSGVKTDLVKHGDAKIRGLVLTSQSFIGTTLIEVPRRLWLELRFWPELERHSLAHHSTCSDLSDSELHRLKFASGLALETRRGNASEHSTYLRQLPKLSEYKSFHPSFMNAQLQEDFRSLPVADFAKKTQADEARIQACFMNWQNEPESYVKDVTWEEILGGFSTLRNRGFNPEGAPLLIPVVDLINTDRSDRVNADVHVNMDMVSLVVSSAWLGSNEELLFGYCTFCDNDVMLSQWGVYLDHNTNQLPSEHKVDCQGTQAVTNTSGGLTKSLQEVASAALDLQDYQEGHIPKCKAATFESEQGPLRCSMARLTWEYCGSSWMQKPGALYVANGSSGSESPDPDGIFLKAKKGKNSKIRSSEAANWASMVDTKYIPLNSTRSFSTHRNASHNRSSLRRGNAGLHKTLGSQKL